MDKYLIIILMFLVAGMIISITREPFIPGLFYSMLGGSIIIVIYSSMKTRKERQEQRRLRKSKK